MTRLGRAREGGEHRWETGEPRQPPADVVQLDFVLEDLQAGTARTGALPCVDLDQEQPPALLPGHKGKVSEQQLVSVVAARVLEPTVTGVVLDVDSVVDLTTAVEGESLELTRSTALEYAPRGVRIDAICPGTFETPMVTEMITKGELDVFEATKNQPIGRLGRADEIAAAVLWPCSPGASFVLGVALPVDGGYTAQ